MEPFYQIIIALVLIVFFSPVIFFTAFLFWSMAGSFLQWIFSFLMDKENPKCSINPRDHPSFGWDKDGNGWIENYMVIRKNDHIIHSYDWGDIPLDKNFEVRGK